MAHFSAVSDEDLARARRDPAFRRKLLSESLEVLLATLNKMRASSRSLDKASARQIRDGVDLAVKLADLLQSAQRPNEPTKAA